MKRWDVVSSACSTCTAGASVVCMSSMGAAIAALGAATGAGATGMAGMGSMTGSLLLTGFFESIGLGILNRLPNEIAQPLLIALILLSIATTYIAYRAHRQRGALVLAGVSGLAMYAGIYLSMSEFVYFISLIAFIIASVWGFTAARNAARVPISK